MDRTRTIPVTVIIPVRRGESAKLAITSLRSAGYPSEKLEVFIARGNCPSAQRNRGADLATGDILYFLNNNSVVKANVLDEITSSYNGREIGVVGGPNLTSGNSTLLQRIFGYALSSYFAHGIMRSRYSSVGQLREANEKELILNNLSIKRDVFKQLRGFNEVLYPNEENEFLNRISSKGFKLIYNPKAIVYIDRRRSLCKFIRQMFNYGKGRMGQIFIEGPYSNLYFFIPLIYFLYFASLIFKHDFYYLIPLAIYIFGALTSAAMLAINKKEAILTVLLPAVYLSMHTSYAMGMIWKFVLRIFDQQINVGKKEVTLEKIKAFGDSWA